MAIDWNAVRPQQPFNPGAEIASVTNMLQAFAEGRERRRQHEEQLAVQQQHFLAQEAHQKALEQYNRDILENTKTYQAQQIDAEKEKHKQAQAEKEREIALQGYKDVTGALDARRPDLAAGFAQLGHIGMSPGGGLPLPDLPPSHGTPQQQPPPQQNPLSMLAPSLFGGGGTIHGNTPDVLAPAPQPQPQAGPSQQQQLPPIGGGLPLPEPRSAPQYRLTGPGGVELGTIDTGARERSADELAKEADRRLAGMAASANTPIRKETLADVRALVINRQIEAKDAGKYYVDLLDKREQRRQSGINAATVSKTRAEATAKPTGEDLSGLARLDADMKNINQVASIIQKTPGAFEEYRGNQENWIRQQEASKNAAYGTIRSAGQGLGMANVAPEQGLKTKEGKRVHQGYSSVTNSIARGYGGVITESDRASAASELSMLAQTPDEAIETLRRIKSNLETKKRLFMQNKRLNTAGTQPLDEPATEPDYGSLDMRAQQLLKPNAGSK